MSPNRRQLLIGGAVLGVALLAGGALLVGEDASAEIPVFTGAIEGVAINGYDPVAYFTQGKPVEGAADHVLDHQGVTWRFASAENRDTFAADPARYAPRYGGYCAFAMARGSKVKTDPAAFSIEDGKLYLNYDLPVRERWTQSVDEYIAKADEAWKGITEP